MSDVIALPGHPASAAPVAAALMLTEGKPFARTPAPVVLMHDDSSPVRKIVRLMRVPTGVALAYDRRGCACHRNHDHACADCGSGKDISQHLRFASMCSMPRCKLACRTNVP